MKFASGCVWGLVFLVALACGCRSQPQRETAKQPAASFEVASPATFSGVLPCADCSGIRYTLNLEPGNVFYLCRTYLGKGEGEGESFYDLGPWSFSTDTRKLVLSESREGPLEFLVKSSDVLAKLDLQGNEIQSQANYNLTRAAGFQWFDVSLPMRGMYSYMADAGLMTECRSGKRFPVAHEGDNAALETAYSGARKEPAEMLLVIFEGRIAMRPRMEVEGEQPTIVVDRFTKVSPGETCESPGEASSTGQSH